MNITVLYFNSFTTDCKVLDLENYLFADSHHMCTLWHNSKGMKKLSVPPFTITHILSKTRSHEGKCLWLCLHTDKANARWSVLDSVALPVWTHNKCLLVPWMIPLLVFNNLTTGMGFYFFCFIFRGLKRWNDATRHQKQRQRFCKKKKKGSRNMWPLRIILRPLLGVPTLRLWTTDFFGGLDAWNILANQKKKSN